MNMLIAIIFIYVVFNFLAFIYGVETANFAFVNPFWIYKEIKVNWFGAFLIAIILNLLLPLISIMYWIYKLCTVGRE